MTNKKRATEFVCRYCGYGRPDKSKKTAVKCPNCEGAYPWIEKSLYDPNNKLQIKYHPVDRSRKKSEAKDAKKTFRKMNVIRDRLECVFNMVFDEIGDELNSDDEILNKLWNAIYMDVKMMEVHFDMRDYENFRQDCKLGCYKTPND